MEKVAIYGKGGIGKSVIATGLSATWAMAGRRVLHVGCDPKHDSAIRLIDGGPVVRTVLDILGDDPAANVGREVLFKGRHNIDCCESGGPPAGLGCGGRGVARTIEYLGEIGLLEQGDYDAVVFDVLGDVVCGGFAAPLREGFATKIVIVISEEPMALFAANNVARAVLTYRNNGVVLAGLVANLRSNNADRDFLHRFAERLSTRILAIIERDKAVMDAERVQKTIVEYAPSSQPARAIMELARALESLNPDTVSLPTPMTEQQFFEFVR